MTNDNNLKNKFDNLGEHDILLVSKNDKQVSEKMTTQEILNEIAELEIIVQQKIAEKDWHNAKYNISQIQELEKMLEE